MHSVRFGSVLARSDKLSRIAAPVRRLEIRPAARLHRNRWGNEGVDEVRRAETLDRATGRGQDPDVELNRQVEWERKKQMAMGQANSVANNGAAPANVAGANAQPKTAA